jgi:anti-repressor protein
MNQELIRIHHRNNQQLVDARELHEFLENKRQFSDWIRQRIDQYGFIEYHDYISFHKIVKRETGATTMFEYGLTLDMAKELSMVENNEKGKIARRYFIRKEREASIKLDTISRKDLARMLYESEETKERLEAENQKKNKALSEQAPKVLFADSVMTSKQSVLVRDLAKILRQNGVKIGQNRLFAWLRNNGYLCQHGESHNQPTQRSMELSIFEIKKSVLNHPDGSVFVTETTKVTPKGQIYFVNKFLTHNAHELTSVSPISI